jgi:hypothetical protein
MSVSDQIALGRRVITKLTGNASFSAPSPSLATLTSLTNDLEAAYDAAAVARQSSKQATSTMMDKRALFMAAMSQEAAYVQNASAGDTVKIESAGFETANPTAPIGDLPAPADVKLDANVDPGHMGVRWEPVRGAASYIVERATDSAPTEFSIVATPTLSKALVNTMVSGQRYWFRIAAVGAAGIGVFTLPIAKIVP